MCTQKIETGVDKLPLIIGLSPILIEYQGVPCYNRSSIGRNTRSDIFV